jgi:hypothetical protein
LTAFLHLNFARIFLEFADPTSAFWGPCIWHQHFFAYTISQISYRI